MTIELEQAMLTFDERYRVVVDGVELFRARMPAFRLMYREIGLRIAGGRPVGTIEQTALWKPAFTITLEGQAPAYFRTVDRWRSHYVIAQAGRTWEFFRHRQRKASLYEGERQVACFGKDLISILGGDRYTAQADDDLSPALLAAIMLIWDVLCSGSSGQVFSIDLASIAPPKRRSDPTWRPRTGTRN